MGQFSWKCSDTDNALIEHYIETDRLKPDTWTKKAYLLIPKEFGGGSFVADHNYDGYGHFFDKNGGKHDVYVELARWLGITQGPLKEPLRARELQRLQVPGQNRGGRMRLRGCGTELR